MNHCIGDFVLLLMLSPNGLNQLVDSLTHEYEHPRPTRQQYTIKHVHTYFGGYLQ